MPRRLNRRERLSQAYRVREQQRQDTSFAGAMQPYRLEDGRVLTLQELARHVVETMLMGRKESEVTLYGE